MQMYMLKQMWIKIDMNKSRYRYRPIPGGKMTWKGQNRIDKDSDIDRKIDRSTNINLL